MTLLADRSAVTPGGTATLALRCRVAKPWHTYWPGVNDTGATATIEFTLPKGWTIDPPRWPAPKRHVSGGELLDHVLDGEFSIVYTLHIPPDCPVDASRTLSVRAEWLVCDRVCIVEESRAALTLRTARVAQVDQSGGADIEAAVSRLPTSLPPDASAQIADKSLRIHWPGAASLSFFPLDTGVTYVNLLKQATRREDSLTISIIPEDATTVSGVVEAIWIENGIQRAERATLSIPIPSAGAPRQHP